MKKTFSLIIAVLMMFSVISPAYAAPDPEAAAPGGTTIIEFVGGSESYTVSVPEKLAPGETGTIAVSGQWGESSTLKITAPATVTLFNTKDESKTKTLSVSFAGIEKNGDNYTSVSASNNISIDSVDILFGTWRGTLEYTVEMETAPQVTLISFTIDGVSYQAEEGMTWSEFVTSKYNDGTVTYNDLTSAQKGYGYVGGFDGKGKLMVENSWGGPRYLTVYLSGSQWYVLKSGATNTYLCSSTYDDSWIQGESVINNNGQYAWCNNMD